MMSTPASISQEMHRCQDLDAFVIFFLRQSRHSLIQLASPEETPKLIPSQSMGLSWCQRPLFCFVSLSHGKPHRPPQSVLSGTQRAPGHPGLTSAGAQDKAGWKYIEEFTSAFLPAPLWPLPLHRVPPACLLRVYPPQLGFSFASSLHMFWHLLNSSPALDSTISTLSGLSHPFLRGFWPPCESWQHWCFHFPFFLLFY